MKIVLDTNVLLQAISSKSDHHWIWEALKEEKLTLCISTEILLEYEEVISHKRHPELAKLVVDALLSMPDLDMIVVYFNFGLPSKDPDDQKFVDCAITCGADFLVTEDNDFNELHQLPFPPVNVVSPFAFRELFNKP